MTYLEMYLRVQSLNGQEMMFVRPELPLTFKRTLNQAKNMELYTLHNLYLLLGASLGAIIVFGLYLWFCPIQFNHIRFGPSIFIYTYHIGSFMKLGDTIESFEKLFKQRNAKQLLSQKLQIAMNELNLIGAGLYFDDPHIVKKANLRSAVGYIIKLKSSDHVNKLNLEEILRDLQIHNAYIRLFPRCNWIVGFYPFFSMFGPLSYIVGAMRVYPKAAKLEYIKCPPIEVFNGFGTLFTASNDNYVTYLFAQDNLHCFLVDDDMK